MGLPKKTQKKSINIEPKLKTRFLTEYPFRFPDMEARTARAAELRSFPCCLQFDELKSLASDMENEKIQTSALADKYVEAIALIASSVCNEDIQPDAVNNDEEILFVADDMATVYSTLSLSQSFEKVLSMPGESPVVPICSIARQMGARLLDAIKELSCAVPTGNEKFDDIRGLAADAAYSVARELLQYNGTLNKRVNFEFLGALSANLEIMLESLNGNIDMRAIGKQLHEFYEHFMDSFRDEVEGAKERCYVITKDPPKDELEIVERVAALTKVKMQAYNLEFDTTETAFYCPYCYAHQLADELDDVFEDEYANKLNLLAAGMERLANELYLPSGRGDVFADCAFALRQYVSEDEPIDIYEQVLQRFACALVELAGLIFCGGISAREAAHKAWLDEDFLLELSQRQGVKDYFVAMQRLDRNSSS